MKISARNLFKGTISALQNGTVNSKVEISLGGGDKLTAVVTQESSQELGLATGKEVVAIIKAPWIMLMTDTSDVRLSARNILTGTVRTLEAGAVNTEVTLTLPGGTEITSVVTKEAITELGLRPGSTVSAVIKASNIILGVPT